MYVANSERDALLTGRSLSVVTGNMQQQLKRGAQCPSARSPCNPSVISQRGRTARHQAVAIPEIASIASSVQNIVDTIASAAPGPLQPAVQVIGGDIASVAALAPTMPGLARLTVSDCSHQ